MLQLWCKGLNIHITPVQKCCLLINIPEIRNTNYWICVSPSLALQIMIHFTQRTHTPGFFLSSFAPVNSWSELHAKISVPRRPQWQRWHADYIYDVKALVFVCHLLTATWLKFWPDDGANGNVDRFDSSGGDEPNVNLILV